MTISSETNKLIYVGDDATVAFPFSFLIYANTEIEVVLTDEDGVETVQTIGTHYTVNAGPWPSGGTVTMVTAPATGSPDDELLTLRRNFPYTQGIDYITAGKFPAESHEQGLDRAVGLIQQMREIVDRSILAQTSEDLTSIDLELPNITNRASMFLAFDSLGNLTVAAGTSANLGPVSPYIDTLLPAVDAAAARAILESVGASVANILTGANIHKGANTFEYGPNYAVAAGTDTYTATLTPTLTALRAGAIYPINFANASTVVAPTLQLEALGAKTLKGPNGGALLIGQINGNHFVQYDGTNMRVLNPHDLFGFVSKGYTSGLVLSKDSGDTTNDINVTAGECADSADAYKLELPSETTKQMDATFAVGDDAGGMRAADHPISVSTQYYAYLMRKDSDGSFDVIGSSEASSPTLPAGWTVHRQIGKFYRSAAGANINISYNIDANTETGEWTPTIQDDSLSDGEGQTYSVQTATFTKIGKQVLFQGRIQVSSIGSLTGANVANLAGLPFTSHATNTYGSVSMGFGAGLAITAGNTVAGFITTNVTSIDLRKWSATTGTTGLTVTEVSADGELVFTGSYTAA